MVYSDPAVTQSETLPQVLLARALSEPSGLAERHKRLGIWREFTWANVLERVRALALGLESKGLKAGDSVMMIGENEPEHFWAEYAVQSLGGKVLSVYPDQTAEEILYLAQDSQTRVFLAQDQEQVDKCLEVADEYDGAIAIVYWDGSGLWGYDHPLGGRSTTATQPALKSTSSAEKQKIPRYCPIRPGRRASRRVSSSVIAICSITALG